MQIQKIMNVPAGAGNDPAAPYNMNEKVYDFSVDIIGKFYYEYIGDLDVDDYDIQNIIKERITELIKTQGDIDMFRVVVDV